MVWRVQNTDERHRPHAALAHAAVRRGLHLGDGAEEIACQNVTNCVNLSGMSTKPLAEIIADRTEAVREKLKADPRNRAEISKASGLSAVTLSYFANGVRDLSPEAIDRLFDALKKNN